MAESYKKASVRAEVWDRSNGLCHYCGKEMHPIRGFHVDHVIPRCKGGTDDLSNLVASCPTCNMSKGGSVSSRWNNVKEPEQLDSKVLVQALTLLVKRCEEVEAETRIAVAKELREAEMLKAQTEQHKKQIDHAIFMITNIAKLPKRDRSAFKLSEHTWGALQREYFISDK